MTKNKTRYSIILFVGLYWGNLINAQESLNSSGGDANGSGGFIAFTVGQILYTADIGISGGATHGVQHAYEIYSVGVKEENLNISLTAFPNPTTDNLTLHINHYTNEKLAYQLFDLQDKLLNSGQVTTQQTQINIASYPTSTYFINVINQENKIIQSFKIVKN